MPNNDIVIVIFSQFCTRVSVEYNIFIANINFDAGKEGQIIMMYSMCMSC
jgi:hypothetical protein